MLRNNIKIAYRNILRDRSYSLINIFGLAIGMAATILIWQYVSYERSYDAFNTDADRIYRVKQDRFENGVLSTEWAAGAHAIGPNMRKEFSEIESYVKISHFDSDIIEYGDKLVEAKKTALCTDEFFEVFSYPIIKGDKKSCLKEPFTVMLSNSLAKKIFGDVDPMGKTLNLNRNSEYIVSGFFEDFPPNSHLQVEALFSYQTFVQLRLRGSTDPDNHPDNAWDWDGCLTYVKLIEGATPAAVEAKLPNLVATKHPDTQTGPYGIEYSLMPLLDVHLYSHYMGEAEPNGDGNAVYILLAAAIFIMLIAWVNYINLATARAMRRAKEVGVRKTVGSTKQQLIQQFMVESAVLNALSFVFALVLVAIALPAFNYLTDMDLGFGLFLSPAFWAITALLFVLGSLLAGAYPAFVLSRFRPIDVLKGGASNVAGGMNLRKGLVLVQFSASVFLIIGTLTVFSQLRHMQNQDLGADIDQILVLNPPRLTDSTYDARERIFKNEMLQNPFIKNVTVTGYVPGEKVGWNAGGIRLVKQAEEEGKQYRVIPVEADYLKTFDIPLLAGKDFDPKVTRRRDVMLNETAVKQIGYENPEDVLNQELYFWGDTLRIVGVVKNWHQESLHTDYDALVISHRPGSAGKICIKSEGKAVEGTLAAAKSAWGKAFPDDQFHYEFLDESFAANYKADKLFGQVFGFFTLLALFVACLGLFGLASFMTAQRKKEIGIRKVLGASVRSISSLLTKDFLVLVGISILIASPIAYYLMDAWLADFAHRINLSWWIFAAAAVISLLVAVLTVGGQSLKAALAEPMGALRRE